MCVKYVEMNRWCLGLCDFFCVFCFNIQISDITAFSSLLSKPHSFFVPFGISHHITCPIAKSLFLVTCQPPDRHNTGGGRGHETRRCDYCPGMKTCVCGCCMSDTWNHVFFPFSLLLLNPKHTRATVTCNTRHGNTVYSTYAERTYTIVKHVEWLQCGSYLDAFYMTNTRQNSACLA